MYFTPRKSSNASASTAPTLSSSSFSRLPLNSSGRSIRWDLHQTSTVAYHASSSLEPDAFLLSADSESMRNDLPMGLPIPQDCCLHERVTSPNDLSLASASMEKENRKVSIHQVTKSAVKMPVEQKRFVEPRNTKMLLATPARRTTAFFGPDDEIDSTPFFLCGSWSLQKTPETSQTTPSARRLKHVPPKSPLQLKSTAWASCPVEFDRSQGIQQDHEGDDDMFGLGTFQDVFITEQDLKRAEEKMADEQTEPSRSHKTQKETALDYVHQLLQWESQEKLTDSDMILIQGVRICYNYIVVGLGSLVISSKTLEWQGKLLGVETERVLWFPIHCISDLHSKCLPDEPPLAVFTYQAVHFLQFMFECETKVDRLVNWFDLKKRPDWRQNTQLMLDHELKSLEEEERFLLQAAQCQLEKSMKQVQQKYEQRSEQIRLHMDERRNRLKTQYSIETGSAPSRPTGIEEPDLTEDCPLCFTNVKSKVIEPCGHALCDACAQRMIEFGIQTCPWDRQVFEGLRDIPSTVRSKS